MTNSEILIYQNPDGDIRLDVRLEDETVWLTQEHMARLFGKGRSTVTEHINNIFKEAELDEKLVCRDFRHTTKHEAIAGKTQGQWQRGQANYVNYREICTATFIVCSRTLLSLCFFTRHFYTALPVNPDNFKQPADHSVRKNLTS